jgi:hypothetical protein
MAKDESNFGELSSGRWEEDLLVKALNVKEFDLPHHSNGPGKRE